MKTNTKNSITIALVIIWIINCIIGVILAITTIWIPHMNASGKGYTKIQSDPFDGTVMPISYIPNWTKSSLQNKKLDFRNIPTNELIPIPKYNTATLSEPKNILERFTYTVPYMGSYTLNYKEFDGSHLGVDIRAPIGTPVLSIANGVVVRAIEADASGNKFVVIRHDKVPVNGKNTTLYSGYLHLSEISVQEGVKIRKGEMLGRVGMTGITTTPHLHFQIDTADAPFHPYWPYTSSEARAKGLTFLQAVTAGLGADKAQKYTINPLVFVQHYLSGNETHFVDNARQENVKLKTLDEIVEYIAPEVESAPEIKSLEELVHFSENSSGNVIVASQTTYNASLCENLKNISGSEQFLNTIFKLSVDSCIFSHIENFSENAPISRADALLMIMKFYKETPLSGLSPFMDIPIGNEELQGYANRAYEKGIFSNIHFFPNNTLTRGEFVEILGRFGHLKNANGKRIYTDVDQSSALYKNIQNYGLTIGTKHKSFSPNTQITQKEAAELLAKLLP